MKPTDKIEIEVWDLRNVYWWLNHNGSSTVAESLVGRYPAAFAPKDEWEDVTNQCAFLKFGKDLQTQSSRRIDFEAVSSNPDFKIENNRIWRKKS